MLNFFEELYKHIGMEYGTGFKLFFIGGKAIYVEGYIEIKEFTDTLIEFRFKKECITIEGTGLSLKKFEKDFSVVVGNILRIERIQNNEK